MAVVHHQCADLLKSGREHFGYRDGFSQPALPGVSDGRRSRRGEGVQQPRLRLAGEAWRDLKLGEFVLGHEDEDGVVPGKDEPLLLNGTFMVWRKLRQDVDAFTRWIEAEAGDNKDAQNVLRAKILGRWPNGDSLVRHPAGVAYHGGARGHDLNINDFTYAADADGVRCPLGAHVRRSNPRDALGFRTERTRRNRIIRRGLPYVDRDETRGLIFVCFNASIARQFEQIQGNWLMDGDSFGLGAERDFLTAGLDPGQPSVRMTIHGDRGRPPSFVTRTEQFVTVRGGHYLFVPGLAALRMIAGGG
jgi:Dyp-type peroxidase family